MNRWMEVLMKRGEEREVWIHSYVLDRKTDRQTKTVYLSSGQFGREAGKQGGREAGRQGGRKAGRQGGRKAGRQGGRQGRQEGS
jgi:hypothetical protein